MFCNNCGTALENGVRFCPTCGAPAGNAPADSGFDFGENSGVQQTEPVITKKKSKLPLIIGVAVLALALIIGLFACGGSGSGSHDALVGNWEGVAFYADEMMLDAAITGEFSFTANSDGTCKLVMPSLGDTPGMVWAYDAATTDSYNATKTDGSTVEIYSVAFATSPDTTIYYAMITDDGMGLLSTDAFSTSYTYKLIFHKG